MASCHCSLGRSVSTSWRRPQGRLSASLCDGASATLAPVTTTSRAARTRERGRSRVGLTHFSATKHIRTTRYDHKQPVFAIAKPQVIGTIHELPLSQSKNPGFGVVHSFSPEISATRRPTRSAPCTGPEQPSSCCPRAVRRGQWRSPAARCGAGYRQVGGYHLAQ
jgi:hypothetical protein